MRSASDKLAERSSAAALSYIVAVIMTRSERIRNFAISVLTGLPKLRCAAFKICLSF
jgi:hypothetical protein